MKLNYLEPQIEVIEVEIEDALLVTISNPLDVKSSSKDNEDDVEVAVRGLFI